MRIEFLTGFKASKTLLGIETHTHFIFIELNPDRFKASKTLLGIETAAHFPIKDSFLLQSL